MQSTEDGERALLRMRHGEALIAALEEWAESSSFVRGEVLLDGAGSLSELELEDSEGERRRIGSAEALRLHGVLFEGEVVLNAMLLRGSQVIAGRIVSGTVVSCAIRAERFAGTSARVVAPIAGAEEGERTSAAESRAPAISTGGWAAAVQASQTAAAPAPRPAPKKKKRKRAPAESSVPLHRPAPIPTSRQLAKEPRFLEEPQPEPGEFVLHKQFGKCKILRMQNDGGALLKLPTGRSKLIKLDIFDIQEPITDKKGDTVYELMSRKKRS